MELCLNPDLIKKWKRMIKKESDDAKKLGVHLDTLSSLEVNFLRNLIEEFLEVLYWRISFLFFFLVGGVWCSTISQQLIANFSCYLGA